MWRTLPPFWHQTVFWDLIFLSEHFIFFNAVLQTITKNLRLCYCLIWNLNVLNELFVRDMDYYFFWVLFPTHQKPEALRWRPTRLLIPKRCCLTGLGLRLRNQLFRQMAPFWKVWICSPKHQRAIFLLNGVQYTERMSYTLVSLVPDAHWPLDGTISTSWLYRSWEEV